MAQQELNAIVTLRNEVSPWLMILQVVPDGWTFPDYVPGQFASLGLFGSASRCGIATPEGAVIAPDKLIRRAYSIASSPVNREFLEFYVALVPGGALTSRLFNLKIGDRIWLSRKATGAFTFDDSRVPKGANLVLFTTSSGLAPVCQHAENAPEVPARAPGRPHPRCAKFVGLRLSIDPDGHGAPSHQLDLPARHQPAGGGAGSLERCDGSRPGRVDEWGHRAGMGLPAEFRKIRTSSSAAIQKWPNPQLRCSRERVSKRRRGRNPDIFM